VRRAAWPKKRFMSFGGEADIALSAFNVRL
jgi:hypothetical protein